MTADPGLLDHLRSPEAELVTAVVWQSREALEERIGPDWVEVGSSGRKSHEPLDMQDPLPIG